MSEEHQDEEKVIERRNLFLKQCDEIYQKWLTSPASGYLDNLSEDRARFIAILLDTQRLFNETNDYPDWNKFSLDLVRNIYEDFVGFHLVSMQPFISPNGFMYAKEFKMDSDAEEFKINLRLCEYDAASKTKKLKTQVNAAWGEMDADLYREIQDETAREILTDLRNNAGTIMTKDFEPTSWEEIYLRIVEMSGIIHRKTLRGGCNWIATSSELGDIICEECHLERPPKTMSPKFVGTVHGVWKLIIDPLFPKNQILCGRQEELAPAYIYSPYLVVTPTPVVLDPEFFNPRRGLLTRYAKKLMRTGAKWYGRISFGVKPAEPIIDYNI